MTFRNRYFFINLLLCTSLIISGSCIFTGCTGETDIDPTAGNGNLPSDGTRLTVRATASGFQLPAHDDGNDASTRTPIMEGTSTIFQPGDAIGLFCVRKNASGDEYIAEDIRNLKMTYTTAADGTGTWKAPTAELTPRVYTDAVTYFAYYPYTEALTTASVSNEQTIREWLKTNKPLATDMRTLAKLAANDLMTATALPSLAAADRGTLALNFKHEYALLVVKPMGKGPYVPPTGVTAYSYYSGSQSNDWGIDRNLTQPIGYESKMKINNSMACEMSDGTYRILTQATTSNSQISCEYVTYDVGMLPITANALILFGFKANTCYTLEVRINGVTIQRAVQPGDFVYQHNGKIEIYPGDGAVDGNGKIPDYTKAVGIVVTTDPARLTDAECNSQGWNHAYVMGLEYLDTSHSYARTWSNQGVSCPLPLVQGSEAGNYMNGYADTETILAQSNLSDYPIFNIMKEYRGNHTVPAGINRSPWFIPSIGQWFDIMTNICGKSPTDFENITDGHIWASMNPSAMYEKADNQFKKVGGTSLLINNSKQHHIWTSSNNNGSDAWKFMGDITAIVLWWNRKYIDDYDYEMTARPFFAF